MPDATETILRLKQHITSSCNSKIVYGKKGDEVKLITAHDHVCIIEREDGYRFSAAIDLLSGLIIEKDAAPGTAVQHKTIIHRAPVTKKKAVPINQTTLF